MPGSTRITRLGYQSPLLFVTQYERIQIKSHVTSPLSCKKKKVFFIKSFPKPFTLAHYMPALQALVSAKQHSLKSLTFPIRKEDAQLLWVRQGAKRCPVEKLICMGHCTKMPASTVAAQSISICFCSYHPSEREWYFPEIH